MSLSDEAKAVDALSRTVPRCKMAIEIHAVFPPEKMPEVIEMLADKSIQTVSKWVTLSERHSVRIGKSTFQHLLSAGCNCTWCTTTWMAA